MPRSRQRACLQDGLSLNLNRLARQGFIRPGAATGPVGIKWTNRLDAEVASGVITADMSGPHEGWFRIQIGQLDQRIVLVSRPRHFGGRQWYFVCPYMNRRDGVVDAARGPFLCFAAALGAAGGLCFTIHVPR
jgi:hypothetical protein